MKTSCRRWTEDWTVYKLAKETEREHDTALQTAQFSLSSLSFLCCPLSCARLPHSESYTLSKCSIFLIHTPYERLSLSLSRSFRVSIRWTTRERFLQWINVKLFHLSKATHLVKRSSCSEVHIFMGILSFFPSRNVQYSRNRLALFPFHSLVQARVSLLFARSSACIKVCTHW